MNTELQLAKAVSSDNTDPEKKGHDADAQSVQDDALKNTYSFPSHAGKDTEGAGEVGQQAGDKQPAPLERPGVAARQTQIPVILAQETAASELTNIPPAHRSRDESATSPRNKQTQSPRPSEHEQEKDLEAQTRSSSTTTTKEHQQAQNKPPDPNIVDFDGPDDPQNARNWPSARKWRNIAVISAITFLTPLASSMFAPGVPEVMEEFNSSNEQLASFVVSVYILGYALGPVVLAPLSELYGRLPLYHYSNLGFIIFTVACALSSNLNMLIGFRFIEGVFGSCPLTIGGGTIADMIAQEKRGGVMAIWALGPLMGPVIGPVAGGYLTQAAGWRWVFWVIAIACGLFSVTGLLFMRETYAMVILKRKTKKLRKQTGNTNLRSALASPSTPSTLFKTSLVRPLRLLLFSPIVLALSTYMAVVYGYLYLLFTTITPVFESTYNFSSGSVGLTYLGIGIGCLFGVIIFGIASDRILTYFSKRNNGEMKPEYRLPLMIPGAFLIPIGLFIYGWTAENKVHWIAPIIGTSFVGFGLLATFMPIQTYLVDAFTVYAASALAANTILRSLAGALLPLAGRSMYNTLGLGWGNSLLAFIALAGAPIPWVFWRWGERIRKSERFKVVL